MPDFDIEKRNFLKSIIMAFVMAFFIEFGGLQRLVFGGAIPLIDDFAILYSTATGIVLRTINPGPGEQPHLDWLGKNIPTGTTLLRLNKISLGADNYNVPNLDTVMPFVKQNKGINLSYGISCSVIDSNNNVVDTVLCCPTLYQQKLQEDAINNSTIANTLIQKVASIGDSYDPATGNIVTKNKVIQVTPS